MLDIKIISIGALQAITEFLPISSSGHLNLFQYFHPISNNFFIDIFFNTATLISVIIFLRKEFISAIKQIPYLLVSTLPLIFLTVFFHKQIENSFHQINLLPIFFLITTIFLFSTKFIIKKNLEINFTKALIIGFCQSIAIFPGVSRSALTITSALLLGLSPRKAFLYSFYLYIPVSLGAYLLFLLNPSPLPNISFSYILAFIICLILGYFSLKLLSAIVIKNNLWKFSAYTLTISLLLFLFLNYF